MSISRRQILKMSAGAGVAWMTGSLAARRAAAAPATKIPIGMQLWGVRHQCETELPVVLEAIGKMDFATIEMAHSYYGHEPSTWRKLLDDNGLKCCGMHLSLRALQGDAFDETVAIHKVIGTPNLIVASLPKQTLASVSAIEEVATFFNDVAKRLKPHGMKVGYHCHGGDFVPLEGTTPWEVFGENTNDDVLLQLDLGNCMSGGGDPIAMLKKFPGRAGTIHLKDYGAEGLAVFGEGVVNWEEVFAFCESAGGTEYYILEEEGKQGPEALDTYRLALKNFRKFSR
jgi:sugar phosphate isomerase/epimerase